MPSITGSKTKMYSLGERNPVVVSNGGNWGSQTCIETLSAKKTNTVTLTLDVKKSVCASSCGIAQSRLCAINLFSRQFSIKN